MEITRRGFLRGAGALGLCMVPRVFLAAAEQMAAGGAGGTLVVLQLTGGNDGLNTLIPFEDPAYFAARPALAQKKSEVLALSNCGDRPLAFHPRMTAMRDLWEKGWVAVVPGVGYPNPDRSHFRSMDIWHSACPEREGVENGWLGRTLERSATRMGALHVGETALPPAFHGRQSVPSLENIDFLDFLATERGTRVRRMMGDLNERERSGSREIARGVARETLAHLDKLLEIRGQATPVEYPQSALGNRAKLVGQLIAAGFPCRVYYLSQDGYDTHARQQDAHGALLAELSEAIAALFRHLDRLGRTREVTLLVFSEFGRRVAENGSLGTDHGAAAPLFVVSGRARGGVHGAYPSLTDLDEGDLRHGVDFRRIYSELIERVLGVAPRAVLGGDFAPLGVLN